MFPHASVADHVLVLLRLQPVPDSDPSEPVAVKFGLQTSDTLADPKAPLICAAVGLHGNVPTAPKVMTGLSVSTL